MKRTIIYFAVLVFFTFGCQPDREDVFQLTGSPEAPSIEVTPITANAFAIKDASTGSFSTILGPQRWQSHLF